MSLVKPKVSSLVRSQLPEFIREDYQTFLNFLEAYYEFVEQGEVDLKTLRDLDTTLESFIRYFKNELASNLPYSTVDTKFLLQHIKDQYNAKGSEASFRLLFRVLFNKEVTIDYPSKQILRASDGRWNQDVSLFARILTGNPQDPVGKLVDVVTPTKIIRVLVDRRQDVEIEVDRAIRVSDDVYEFLIDRRFFGNVSVGDRLRYRDDDNGIYFTAEILSTTVDLQVLQPGSGFKVGDIYNIKNFDGYGSIMKVSRVDAQGGILQGQFIKYGIGYSTDFTTTVSATSGQDVSGTAGTIIQRVGNNLNISERLDGFAEVGTINTADYNIDPSGIHALDGTYAGTVLREFGISSIDSQVTDTNPAIIKVTLGALAKYPGYYVTNDSFLNDAIYIQDSRYYQAYSYVIKIDEKLEAYKTAVKNLIHPAGMAIFGEYDIRNEFDISLELESLIKILAVTVNDEVTTSVVGETLDLTRTMPFFNSTKSIENSTLNGDGSAEGQSVVMQEIGNASDLTRTMPFWTINKQVIETTLNFAGIAEGQSVLMLDETGSLTTRTMPFWTFSKALNETHVINDGVTVDNETQLISDTTGTGSTRTVPYLDVSKSLNNTTFNFDNVLDDNTATMTEDVISYGYSSLTRTGVNVLNMTNKQLDQNHFLNDGTTIDNETQIISDTDASSASDLNRTRPAFVVTTTLPAAYYVVATTSYAGDNSAVAQDSGGIIDFNPYGEAGYFLNDGGLYVGNEITF
jgi:hypothetical protein